MQDVCDKLFIIASPELAVIFKNHFNRVYHLSWFQPLIVRFKSKARCLKEIPERYETICKQNVEDFYGDDPYVVGVNKMLEGSREFIRNFRNLSHNDIDILRRMTPQEALGIKLDNRFKIETIGGKPIKMEV